MISRLLALTITAALALGMAGSASAAPQNLEKLVSTKDPGKTSWAVFSDCDLDKARRAPKVSDACLIQETKWSQKTSGSRTISMNVSAWGSGSSSDQSYGDDYAVVFRRATRRVVIGINFHNKKSQKTKLKTPLPVKKRVLSNITVTRVSQKTSKSSRTQCRWFGSTLSCGNDEYDDSKWSWTIKEDAARVVVRPAEEPQPGGRWWDPTSAKWLASPDELPTDGIWIDWTNDYGAEWSCEGVTQRVKLRQGTWRATKTLKGIRGECLDAYEVEDGL